MKNVKKLYFFYKSSKIKNGMLNYCNRGKKDNATVFANR